jgi:predicted Holliday junction resolvase-like endonuclease
MVAENIIIIIIIIIQFFNAPHNIKSAMLQKARRLKRELQREKTKDNIAGKTKERWRAQRMRGQFQRNRRKTGG